MKLSTKLKKLGYHRDVISKNTEQSEIIYKKHFVSATIQILYKDEKIIDYRLLYNEKTDINELKEINKIMQSDIKEMKPYEI